MNRKRMAARVKHELIKAMKRLKKAAYFVNKLDNHIVFSEIMTAHETIKEAVAFHL